MMKSDLLFTLSFPYIVVSIFFGLWSASFLFNHRNIGEVFKNEQEFLSVNLHAYKPLADAIASLPNNYAVILLNNYALNMTLNWMCNVQKMNILNKTLFFTLDADAYNELKRFYPTATVVLYSNALSLSKGFKPYDTTYMSFFLMRTNLVQALQYFKKPFWMLQADTVWTDNILGTFEKLEDADIYLDQQGYADIAESRKNIMNGANFYVPASYASRVLVHAWLTWQRWTYLTDPDLLTLLCDKNEFECSFIPHSMVSGWEWIYGDQTNPPSMLQMDGENDGGKEEMMKKYGFWFWENNKCMHDQVQKAIGNINNSTVPKIYSSSKERHSMLQLVGMWLNKMPLFGRFSSIFGGFTAFYLKNLNYQYFERDMLEE